MHPARFLSHGLRGLALAATIGMALQAQADTLYSQPFAQTANGAYWASTPGGFLQFDSFTLSSAATLTSVSWLGVDLNELVGATPINPTSFTVNLYANTPGGLPGTLLSTTTAGDSANAVSTGQDLMGLTLFQYTATLGSSVQLQAGTTYWIGISDPTGNGNWFWASGSGSDAVHAAQIGGAFDTYEDDLAFSLQGTISAVPEPASAAMMVAGLLAAGVLRRRTHRG